MGATSFTRIAAIAISQIVPGSGGPTVAPPEPGSLNSALTRNIEALQERRRAEAAAAALQDKIAERVTSFTGSLWFV